MPVGLAACAPPCGSIFLSAQKESSFPPKFRQCFAEKHFPHNPFVQVVGRYSRGWGCGERRW